MIVSSPGPTSNRTSTSSTSVEPLPSTIDSGGTALYRASAATRSLPE
jgi:hypothetical protein